MKNKLTKKERGFVKDYALTENGTQSALKNYDTDKQSVAAVIANENLSKPKIQQAIDIVKKSLAERIPDDLLEKAHLEGLAATAVRFTPEGERMDVPDFSTRHKYVDSGYKLKGAYAPEKSVNLNIDVEATDNIKSLTERLNALHRGGSQPSDGAPADPVGDQAQDQERVGTSD